MKTYIEFLNEQSADEFKSELSNKIQKHQEEQKSKSKETEEIENVEPDTTSDKLDQLKNSTDLIEDQGKKIEDTTKDIKQDFQKGIDSEDIEPKMDELEQDIEDFDKIIGTAKEEQEDITKDNEK